MSDNEKRLMEKAKKWFSSKEGEESLKKSVETALENNKKLKMRRYISQETLKQPITI